MRHYSVLPQSFTLSLRNNPSKYTKYFCVVISCEREKSKRLNCKALQKRRFLMQDKKKRYGKAGAYHSVFTQYWIKRLLLKRILSYEAPPLTTAVFESFNENQASAY